MIMYPQGTSSLVYPVKNLRIEFTDGQTYSLMDGLPEIDLFCLKADYMESSGSHNTGAANALNSLYEASFESNSKSFASSLSAGFLPKNTNNSETKAPTE